MYIARADTHLCISLPGHFHTTLRQLRFCRDPVMRHDAGNKAGLDMDGDSYGRLCKISAPSLAATVATAKASCYSCITHAKGR